MSYYYVYGNELYHYGVPGMRWGHRKAPDTSSGSSKPRYGSEEYYRNKANRAVARISTSKTRLGKNFNNLRAYNNTVNANIASKKASLGKEKNILKKIDSIYGHGANAVRQNANADYYQRKSEYSKTRLGKTMNEAKAFNEKSAAKANEKLHNSSSIKEYGKNFVDSMSTRKIKTWSGRTTTVGKQMVDQLLTVGVIGTIQDVGYYKNNK